MKYLKLYKNFDSGIEVGDKVKESRIAETVGGAWGAGRGLGDGGSLIGDELREGQEKMIKSEIFKFFEEVESDLELKKSVDEVNVDIERFTEENNIPRLEDAKMRKVNLFLDKAKKNRSLQKYTKKRELPLYR